MHESEQDFSIKSLFVPLITVKAINTIIFVGIIVFFNCLFNPFVIDDRFYITENPSIHHINLYESFFIKDIKFNALGQYRPIPALYFSSLFSLFSTTPFFYHFLQVSLHIIGTILLFLYLKHFFHRAVALLLSLVFLVHPLQVESV